MSALVPKDPEVWIELAAILEQSRASQNEAFAAYNRALSILDSFGASVEKKEQC